MTSRASAVVPAAELGRLAPFDHIVLPHDGRYRRRVRMRTEGDLVFLLDLPQATRLMHGDGLVLDDGRIIGVVAAAEPVVEITADDAQHLARLAWHIGNRHVPAEILPDRIRILPDHTIEDMARGLGGKVQRTEAPFEPEGGAYEHAHAGHGGRASHGHAGENSAAANHGHSHAHDHGPNRPLSADLGEAGRASHDVQRS